MPLSTALRKLLCCTAGIQEENEMEASARQPLPEPAQAGPLQAGRPYRERVEKEAESYWQDMVKSGALVKPDQQELRAAALPVLGLAQRYRPGPKLNPALNRAHIAVNAVQLHLVKRGWLKHPFTRTETMPNYVEALIQLADDADLLAREIPLPDHPVPRHPTIYYTTDPVTGRPVPRKDALICGDYVYDWADGSRITQDEYILPYRDPMLWPSVRTMISKGWDACYTLERKGTRIKIEYHWFKELHGEPWASMGIKRLFSSSDRTMHFSPYPPP